MELITSVVPPGLKNRVRPRLPSDKSLGYYQISLREKDLKHLIHDNDVPKPKASPSQTRQSIFDATLAELRHLREKIIDFRIIRAGFLS